MTASSSILRRLARPALATAFLLAALAPADAAVTTVFNCAPNGHGGNHDSIFNGFFVQNLAAVNLHSVTLYYTTDLSGTYNITLTVRRNSYNGPVVGTATQAVSLSSSSDKSVTWNFDDPAFPTNSTLYFTHTYTGLGGVSFNLRTQGTCPASQESVGTSANLNQFNVAVLITQNAPAGTTACISNATTLCIDNQPGDKRFQVRVTYQTSQSGGLSGNGGAISLTPVGVSRGGLFWFFGADNPEMLVKIINGCQLNSRFWVFYSAGTNVGFRITVTDTTTGHTAVYNNPDLTAAQPVQDTSALTCQ
jgi:hypothetical protein